MSSRWFTAVAVLVPGVLAACSNPFRDTYQSDLERWSSGESSRLLPPEGEPKIVTSDNLRRDTLLLMEDGYLLLGRSRFRGAVIDPKIALDQAKEVGASLVVVAQRYAESVTESVPITEWIPEREVTTKEVIVVESGDRPDTVIEKDVTHTVQGEFRTQYVPQTTDYYEYAATYWGKSKPPIFGVLVEGLDDDARQRIQSNRGVEVMAVIRNSPAFLADVLRGDIIVSFAGETIVDPDQFFDVVVAHQGQEVTIEVNRNGEKKVFRVPLKVD